MFPGLIPLIESYLSGMDVDADTHCSVQQYLKLISRRAAGEIPTMAAWMRDFVTSHPQYKLVTSIFSYKQIKASLNAFWVCLISVILSWQPKVPL